MAFHCVAAGHGGLIKKKGKTKVFPTNVGRPNNSARDCSISLKCRTDFGHVTLDVLQTFKVNGSKVKVTA